MRARLYTFSACSLAYRGRAFKELGLRRTDLIVTTKVFFGVREGPNQRGLSRKHIIEGCLASLERLQLDYGESACVRYQLGRPRWLAGRRLLTRQSTLSLPTARTRRRRWRRRL